MDDFQTLADATYPGSLSTNLYKGKYYGLPLDTNTRVLVTSQAALDAAGMSAPPATFDELTWSEAIVGNRTLVIEPTKLANNAVIADNGS